jgi:hypothetical protein
MNNGCFCFRVYVFLPNNANGCASLNNARKAVVENNYFSKQQTMNRKTKSFKQ